MKIVSCGLLSAGFVLAGFGTAKADDVFRAASPGNAVFKTMEFQGDAQTQQVWWRRGYCGYCGGGYGRYYGGYGGYGGGYGYGSYPYSTGYGYGGGYGGYGGGYGGYGYSPSTYGYGGYGGGYGGYGYSPYTSGYGGYGYSPYTSGYGGGYGGYGGGYGGYGGGYGGYGGGYGGYGYSPYTTGYGYGGYPGYYAGGFRMGVNSAPISTQPAPAAPSTYPYNGGPQSPLPIPGGGTNVAPQQQQTIPAKTLMVSLPSAMSGGVSPIFTRVGAPSRPIAPAQSPARYTFPAYGEGR